MSLAEKIREVQDKMAAAAREAALWAFPKGCCLI